MKKLLLAVIAGVFMSAGVASAVDDGFWFGEGSTWVTYVNATNTASSASPAAATVTFYTQDGDVIGSTTRTLDANENWNFGTSAIGNIASTKFDPTQGGETRGQVTVSGTNVAGYTTIFSVSSNSGFNFRITN